MTRMIQVAELDAMGYLLQCPDCKSIVQTMVDTHTTPECNCDEKLMEEYFGKNYKEELGESLKTRLKNLTDKMDMQTSETIFKKYHSAFDDDVQGACIVIADEIQKAIGGECVAGYLCMCGI